MKPEVRLLAWVGTGAAVSYATAPTFLSLLEQSLGETFGNIFPAIPFAALLTLILALRWRDFRDLLSQEKGAKSEPMTRVAGLGIIAVLVMLEPLTSQTVETAGIAVVLSLYAASLIVNPLSKRFLLPYALIYSAGIGAPFVLEGAFGQPLALLSSELSSRFVGLLGLPVAWHGTQFQLVSKTGDLVSGVVTPGCSSILSVTTFLGLLALMHIDLRKDSRSTATLALAGIVVLTILNSIRIMILMWVGYTDGADAFWGIHNWIGYALFLGFYLSILPVYSRMGGKVPYSPISAVPYTPS